MINNINQAYTHRYFNLYQCIYAYYILKSSKKQLKTQKLMF